MGGYRSGREEGIQWHPVLYYEITLAVSGAGRPLTPTLPQQHWSPSLAPSPLLSPLCHSPEHHPLLHTCALPGCKARRWSLCPHRCTWPVSCFAWSPFHATSTGRPPPLDRAWNRAWEAAGAQAADGTPFTSTEGWTAPGQRKQLLGGLERRRTGVSTCRLDGRVGAGLLGKEDPQFQHRDRQVLTEVEGQGQLRGGESVKGK